MDDNNDDEGADLVSDGHGVSSSDINPHRIKGIVNDIAIISRGKMGDSETFSVVCAVGKEHRLGRWGSDIKGAKNGAVVFELRKKSRNTAAEGVNGTKLG